MAGRVKERHLSQRSTPSVEVCGVGKEPRSCSKICLVKIYPKARPDKVTKVYAILDDQSSRSLARSEFFNLFQISGSDSPYTLRTCAGVTETPGRRATGFMVESLDGTTSVMLPTLIECNHMPDDRSEISTPDFNSSSCTAPHSPEVHRSQNTTPGSRGPDTPVVGT